MKLLSTLVVCLFLVACKQESKSYQAGHAKYDNYTIVTPTLISISNLKSLDDNGGTHWLFYFTVRYHYLHDTFTQSLTFQNVWNDAATKDIWTNLQGSDISKFRVMLVGGHLDNIFIKGSDPNPRSSTVQLVTPLRIIWTRADGMIIE